MEPSSASWKGQRWMGFPVTDHGVVWRKSCVTAFRLDWIFHIRFYSGVKLMHCAIDIGQHWWRTGLSPDCSNHFFRQWSIFVDMIFKGTATSHYLRQWWPVVTYVFTEAWLIITSCRVEIWGRLSNFISHLIMNAITYPCWDSSSS